MRRDPALALRLAALIGFATSALMTAEYALPASAGLCGPGGGCQTVRTCGIANAAGIAWPHLGLLGFGVLLALSVARDHRARRLATWGAFGAAFVGLTLIVLQKSVCHAFCSLCLVADSAGIAAGISAWFAHRRTAGAAPEAPSRAGRWVFGGLAAASLALAGAWHFVRTANVVTAERLARLPAPIATAQRTGVATIVEFSDFECPFCRRQHEIFSRVLPAYGPRVRLERRHVPLRMHVHAEGAARAACCAEEQGRGEPMVDALFRADDLSPAHCESLASQLGVQLGPYRACLSAERTSAHLRVDREAATASGVTGLPTSFVGRERFVGVIDAESLRASIDRALRAPAVMPSG